jgi:hypothetical protein
LVLVVTQRRKSNAKQTTPKTPRPSRRWLTRLRRILKTKFWMHAVASITVAVMAEHKKAAARPQRRSA